MTRLVPGDYTWKMNQWQMRSRQGGSWTLCRVVVAQRWGQALIEPLLHWVECQQGQPYAILSFKSFFVAGFTTVRSLHSKERTEAMGSKSHARPARDIFS